ncbi:MAG: ribonuclease Y [Clostridiales bacterium]|nr:ribonuclease Y [Clostridiales bacterium]
MYSNLMLSVHLLAAAWDPLAIVLVIVLPLVGIAAGFFGGYFYNKKATQSKIGNARSEADKIKESAMSEAKTLRKEAILEAKEEVHKLRSDVERERRESKSEIQRNEQRLVQKEESLDKKEETLERKLEGIEQTRKNLQQKEADIAKKSEEVAEAHNRMLAELEKVAALTKDEAKAQLISAYESEAQKDAAILIRDIENTAKEEAEKRAKNIISIAIQRCAADHAAEITVSVVALPNDDMKGRIIGREGRNIRALENATGIDLIIDDTPEAVILSGFDPVRREVARITLEKLIADGRIHPARIEEVVEKTRKEVEIQIKESGEHAMFDTGVYNLHPELVKLLGRLKFRTSYGQNVLKHSMEVAHLAGLMAVELGADVALCKRAGLLHDIGKAVDHEVEGTHITIGADLARKYKENKEIVHCIAAHHNDIEPTTIEAVLIQAADAISGARPGARRESLENYVKRLEKLEGIANSFPGVEKSFAIQAGREVRIMVKPEQVDDAATIFLAKEIAKKIEGELEYPGQIKVNVIRELRSTEYAK